MDNNIKRYLVIGGKAQEIIENIRSRYRVGIDKGEAFSARVGGTAVQYKGICIDAIAFDKEPNEKIWKYIGCGFDRNMNITVSLYRPNRRTKIGRDLAAEMQQPYLPNEEAMLMAMFTTTVGHLYWPGRDRSPSGKTILSTYHHQGVYPELVDGVREITEQEYHLIMAEDAVDG